LYLFIQKAIAVRRQCNISLENQMEVSVTQSVYAFSRGQVVIVVTNSNAQYSLQLPVSPFAVGDSVCDLMQEQPQCVTVSSNGYSLMMSGQPKVMMHSRSTLQ
jgi:hypothetical protein